MDYKEKVIALLNSKELSKEQKEKLEDIFPELSESEDERIRKALIRYFTLSDEHAYYEACGVSYKDIVDWLEKQSEKSSDTCDSSTINGKKFPASEKRDFGYFSESTDKAEPKFKKD